MSAGAGDLVRLALRSAATAEDIGGVAGWSGSAAACRSSGSASAAVNRRQGSRCSRPRSTGRSGPARRIGSGGSVASALSVAIALDRAYGDWPSTVA